MVVAVSIAPGVDDYLVIGVAMRASAANYLRQMWDAEILPWPCLLLFLLVLAIPSVFVIVFGHFFCMGAFHRSPALSWHHLFAMPSTRLSALIQFCWGISST